ncbi:hypothetical protein K2X89_05240, partial [Myxococcota bacterium]|nr:hypothetical protein [Myxococcota bacterium]
MSISETTDSAAMAPEKPKANAELERLAKQDYKYGFVTDIEEDRIAPGLTEDVVRLISQKKNEPEWLLDYRLKAFRRFREMLEENA